MEAVGEAGDDAENRRVVPKKRMRKLAIQVENNSTNVEM